MGARGKYKNRGLTCEDQPRSDSKHVLPALAMSLVHRRGSSHAVAEWLDQESRLGPQDDRASFDVRLGPHFSVLLLEYVLLTYAPMECNSNTKSTTQGKRMY